MPNNDAMKILSKLPRTGNRKRNCRHIRQPIVKITVTPDNGQALDDFDQTSKRGKADENEDHPDSWERCIRKKTKHGERQYMQGFV
jgi:hypothetical protein